MCWHRQSWAPFTTGGTPVLVDGAVCIQVPRSQPRASPAGTLGKDRSSQPAPSPLFCPLCLCLCGKVQQEPLTELTASLAGRACFPSSTFGFCLGGWPKLALNSGCGNPQTQEVVSDAGKGGVFSSQSQSLGGEEVEWRERVCHVAVREKL